MRVNAVGQTLAEGAQPIRSDRMGLGKTSPLGQSPWISKFQVLHVASRNLGETSRPTFSPVFPVGCPAGPGLARARPACPLRGLRTALVS